MHIDLINSYALVTNKLYLIFSSYLNNITLNLID